MERWTYLWKGKIRHAVAGMCVLALLGSLVFPAELHAADPNEDVRQESVTEEVTEEPILNEDLNKKADNLQKSEENAQTETVEDVTDASQDGEQDTPASEPQVQKKELSLEYDDRYSLSQLTDDSNEWVIQSIKTEEVSSRQVSRGEATGGKDTDVIRREAEGSLNIVAVGVGKAEICLVPKDEAEAEEPTQKIQIHVTVEPATLTVMYVAGQSNAEGWCSSNTGYRPADSVICEEGEVYSTYAPTTISRAKKITGISFSKECTEGNAKEFVAGSLQSGQSVAGGDLEYPLNALSGQGAGKTGMDSGLAYEWNQLTGEKVWVVNTGWGATSISNWLPGEQYYDRSMAVNRLVQETYEAEIAAGHYNPGKRLLFWLQGEEDKKWESETYAEALESMYAGMAKTLNLDGVGIVMVRSAEGSHTSAEDIRMSGPRIAQYLAGSKAGLEKAWVVSNVNEQWVSDAGVKSYFAQAYPDGHLSYQTHSGAAKLPVSVAEVHSNIHYSQIGHNENGITAAEGMYQVLSGEAKASGVSWRDEEGNSLTSLTLDVQDKEMLIPVPDPSYSGKRVRYEVEGAAVTFSEKTGIVTAVSKGTAKIIAYDEAGNAVATLPVTVGDNSNLTQIAGKNYTGLYKYKGTWWYLKNGYIQKNYMGVVKNENGWWYVENGKVDFTYNGFAENQNGWWYIEDGEVTFNRTDVIKGYVNEENAWWYVKDSKVTFTETVAKNKNGWWHIQNGKVNFDSNTVAKNSNGWWVIQDGEVNFKYNGFAQNQNGWWYCKGGKVQFGVNDVIKGTVNGTYAWWHVVKGEVTFDNTVAKNKNGWWHIQNGKVNFDSNTVAKNKNGWWVIQDGEVNFKYNGFAQNQNGWWYCKGGKVQFGVNDVIKGTVNGKKAWWYVVKGEVTFTDTVAKNKNGWWRIEDGKVNFNANTVAKNSKGWWVIRNGKVDFGYNGIAKNGNGSWLCKNGKVNFGYSGKYQDSTGSYIIEKGQVKNI